MLTLVVVFHGLGGSVFRVRYRSVGGFLAPAPDPSSSAAHSPGGHSPPARTRRGRRPLPAVPEATGLAAVAALLHRYSGTTDVLIGYDTLPLRLTVTPLTSFEDLVRSVTATLEEARAHGRPDELPDVAVAVGSWPQSSRAHADLRRR